MKKWQRLLAMMVALVMLIATSGFSGFADETVPADTGAPVETVAEAPVVEAPVVEAPAVEPVAEEPVEEEPVEEEPVEEEPVEEEPIEEEPVEEEPVEEEPVEEEPVEEEPVEEEPVEEEPVEEEPIEEEPVEEEPVEEEPVEEEPVEEEPVEEIVGILKVTCEGGVEGEETIIKISAMPEVTVLMMAIEEDEVIWKERDALKAEEITDDEEGRATAEAAAIIIKDDGDSRLWEIKHVFEYAGRYELVFQGSVDGETWSNEYVVKGVEITEPEVEEPIEEEPEAEEPIEEESETEEPVEDESGTEEPIEEESETEEPVEDESETEESVQDDIVLIEGTQATYSNESSQVELAAADDIDILYVYCGNGIAKKSVTIRVDAENAVTSVKMNIGDSEVIWNEGDDGVEIVDCGNYREWQIVYTFEWAGTYNLSYQGSADGATWGEKYWADTVSMKDADVLYVYCGNGIAKKPVTIRIDTNATITSVKMNIGDSEVIWNEGDEDVTVESYSTYKTWYVKYAFEWAGTYGLSYQGSADGTTWGEEYWADTVSMKDADVLYVYCGNGIAKKSVTIRVDTNATITSVKMNIGDQEVIWNEGDEDVTVESYSTYKTWYVKYAFEWAGTYGLSYQGSADGTTWGEEYWADTVSMKDADVLYVYCGNGIAKKSVTIRVDTNATITSLKMNIGDQEVIWNEGDEGVTVEAYDTYKTWQVVHTFEWAGEYGLSYQGSADGTTWGEEYWADTVTMKDADVLYAFNEGGSTGNAITMRVDTNTTIISLKMNIGDQEVIWNEGDEGVTVEAYDTYKTWYVVHTFEWAGEYGLSYQGSADGITWGEEYWADPTVITEAKACSVESVSVEGDMQGEALTFTVVTGLDAAYLYAVIDGDVTLTWSVEDEDVTVADDEEYRTWIVSYTFEEAGEYNLIFSASDNGVDMGNDFEMTVTVVQKANTYEGFGYTTNDAGTGIIITSYEYNGMQANVIVPDTIDGLPVVEIGSEVFFGNTVMTSISLPDTVQVIGIRAFANCTALSSMTCTAA